MTEIIEEDYSDIKKQNHVSQTDLSKIFGYNRNTFNTWKTKGMPHHDDGIRTTYDTVQVYKWLVRKALKERGEDGDMSSVDSDQSPMLERYRKIKAEKEEFSLEVMKEKYVLKEDRDADIKEVILLSRKIIQLLGKELSFKLSKISDASECQRIIDNRGIELLEELSKGPAKESVLEETTDGTDD